MFLFACSHFEKLQVTLNSKDIPEIVTKLFYNTNIRKLREGVKNLF